MIGIAKISLLLALMISTAAIYAAQPWDDSSGWVDEGAGSWDGDWSGADTGSWDSGQVVEMVISDRAAMITAEAIPGGLQFLQR